MNECKLGLISLSVASCTVEQLKQKLHNFVAQAVQQEAQLIVLPEFSIAPLIAAFQGDEFTATECLEKIIIFLAQAFNCYICGGSGVYKINQKLYNRSFLVNPKGEVLYQPKINLIQSEQADGFVGGDVLHVIQTPFAKLAICICYDIEFPELVRKLVLAGIDLIINPSYTIDQYGESRIQHCAQARAVENHIFVAKTCLVGKGGDPATPMGFGKSALITPIDHGFTTNGIASQTHDATQEALLIATVDFEQLNKVRRQNSTSPLNDFRKLKLNELLLKNISW